MSKKRAFLILFFACFVFLFGQSSLVDRYLKAANTSYTEKNYAKAFEYINYVYGQYSVESVPQNVEVLGELIYYEYLNQMRVKEDFSAFKRVKDKLLEYPALSSERVTRLVRILNTLETQKKSQETSVTKVLDLRDAMEYKIELEKIKAELQALQEVKESMEREKEMYETQKSLYEKIVTMNQEQDAMSKKIALIATSIVVAFFVIAFSVTMIFVRISEKRAGE